MCAQWTVPAVRGRTDFIPLPCHCVGILSSMAITASTALAVESRPLSDGPLDQLRSKSQNAATLSSRTEDGELNDRRTESWAWAGPGAAAV